MSNEKADEFLSWRTKLTQPDALPDQGLDDPESTWQQIYARLVEQRPRRPFYWYGVAAACLLLALAPAALLLRDQPASATHPGHTPRQGSIGPAASPHPAASPSPGIPIPPDGSWTIRSDRPVPHTDRPVLRTIHPIPPSHPAATLADSRRTTFITPIPPSTAGTPLSYPPGAPSDPVTATASPGQPPPLAQQPPVRRTLRVISINEIDDPVAPALTPTLARASTPFKVRLQTGKGFTRQASADREGEADPQFLQLKISLQNP